MSWPSTGTTYSSLKEAKKSILLAASHAQMPITITHSLKDRYVNYNCTIEPLYACSFAIRLVIFGLGAQTARGGGGPSRTKWGVQLVCGKHTHGFEGISEKKREEYGERMELARRKVESEKEDEMDSSSRRGMASKGSGGAIREKRQISEEEVHRRRKKHRGSTEDLDEESEFDPREVESPNGDASPKIDDIESAATKTFQKKLKELVKSSFLPFPPSPSPSLSQIRLNASAAALQRNFSLRLKKRNITTYYITMHCAHNFKKKEAKCGYMIKIEWDERKGWWAVREESTSVRHLNHSVLSEEAAKVRFLVGDLGKYEKGPKSEFEELVESMEDVAEVEEVSPPTTLTLQTPPSSRPTSSIPSTPIIMKSSILLPPKIIPNSHPFLPNLSAFLFHLSPTLVPQAQQLISRGIKSEENLCDLLLLSEGSCKGLLRQRRGNGEEMPMAMRVLMVKEWKRAKEEIGL